MPISTTARLLASVASLAILAASGPALAQQGPAVGTAAAVNPRSTGSAGGGARVLELGASIIHRERIETSASGSVQVMFVDKTTLNIGPGSSLVIDEFVYDPNAKTGSMAVSLTKGAVRFVGGNASHTGGAEVKTPVATIGIRGGVAAVIHRDGETQAILQFGTLTIVGPGGETVVVRRPGFMVTVGRAGIAGPLRVSQAQIDAIIAQTRSRTGQNGGRPDHTPDVTGLDKAASHPCALPVQGQTTMDLSSVTCRYVNTELQGEADTIAQQAAQQNQQNVLIPVTPPPYGYGGGGPGGYGGFPGFPNLPGLPGGPGSYGGGGLPHFPGFPNLPGLPGGLRQ
ncbi:FecR family protein [Xanthobacter autotrophicus DSM 431]|uniref:FecR family protein n=1 Tax=Xanthobacter nonsaccharivorans TaxID=3119912 RepID=UPI003729CEA6